MFFMLSTHISYIYIFCYGVHFFFCVVIFQILPVSIDYSAFLCSDDNLIEALKHPTGYCQAQG